jgi:hypothetical protein
MQRWIVRVYKQDRRCKAGERLVAEYPFQAVDRAALDQELRDVQDRYVTVKNLMTGAPVQIEAQAQGGPCDPSTERYWTM